MSYETIDDTLAFEDINIPLELLENQTDTHQEAAEGGDDAIIKMANLVLNAGNGQSVDIAIQLYRVAANIGNVKAMVCAVKLMRDAQNISDAGQWCLLYLTRILNAGNFNNEDKSVDSLILIAQQLTEDNSSKEIIECNDLLAALADVAKLKEKYAENLIKYNYGMSEKMKHAIQISNSSFGPSLDKKERLSVKKYKEMLAGSAGAAFELAKLYATGESVDGEVDLKTATKLYEISAIDGFVDAMPAHILRLKAEFNYSDAYRLAPIYLSRMLEQDCVGYVSKSSIAEMVKIIIKLLSHSRVDNVCTWIDADATIKMIEKAREESLVDEKLLTEAYAIEATIKAHKNKSLIIVAKDKFVEGGDFKVGQYKSLWRASKLVDAPISESLEVLNTLFPWMSMVTRNIIKQVRAREYGTNHTFKIRPILLVGPPGGGKTSYCRALSEIIGVPFRTFMAAGSDSALAMRGVARGYSTASPGFMPRFIAQEGVANGLTLIDEIDKCSTGRHNGSLLDVMLQLLEPATSSVYYDEALEVRLDLSHANWIATANSLSAIPKPLLSRFEVILAGEPDASGYAQAIVKTRIDYAKELGVDARMMPALNGEDVDWLTNNCKSLREIARVTRSVLEDRMCAGQPIMH